MSDETVLPPQLDVAAQLPFDVENYERANAAFARWRAEQSPEALRVVELWTYAYVQAYFRRKAWRGYGGALLEEGPTEAYQRILDALPRIEHPESFAAYASVVCKRTFLSLRRRRQHHPVSLDRVPEPSAVSVDPAEADDGHVVRHVVRAALDRLPNRLRLVAEARLLRGVSYQELEDETGIPLPVLRSYYHKALSRLRDDPALRVLLQ